MITNTAALFGRVSKNADQPILPINDSALNVGQIKTRFYCVHSVSGVAGTDFLALANHLDPSIGFFGIQAPRSEMRKPEFGDSIESIAAYYAEALAKFQPQGALHIGGYCVGGIIALEMARVLRAAGRQVGLLVVIDGVPENTGVALSRWNPRYWLELVGNVPSWFGHSDLMRSKSLRSLFASLAVNGSAVGMGMLGLRRGERLRGGFAMDSLMDLSVYPQEQRAFINRLFSAIFSYTPKTYVGDIVVYEAGTAPLLYSPQIARIWSRCAPGSKVVEITGTHIGMMREPYVEAMALDLRRRIETWPSPA